MPAVLVGLASLLVCGLFVWGWVLMRSDALSDLDVADIALLRDTHKTKRRQGPLDRLAQKQAPALARAIGPKRVAQIRRKIDLAGRPDGMTVNSFLEVVVRYLVLLGPIAVLFLILGNVLAAVAVLAAIYLLPMSRITGQQRKRRTQIDDDLPDLLDVLAVTVGAGIGFRSAMDRVAMRFDGPLRDELSHTLRELDVGVPRRTAFTSLRDRTDSEAMGSFVSAFLQAEELGAPLAEALNQIARDSRREAAQRARRKAARTVPQVTLLVTTVFVPPTILVIVVGMYLGSDIQLGSIFGG